MAHVFISYADQDEDVARALMEAIERSGVKAFRGLSLGPAIDWAGQIDDRIESAQCNVLLWSAAAAESRYDQKGIQQAIRAWSEGRLVIATLDDTALPIGMRDLQGIPVRKTADGVDATGLLKEIKSIVLSLRERPIDGAVASVQHSSPAPSPPPPPRRHGAMSLVGVLVALVTTGMALSWISGDFEPPRRGGGMGGMGKGPGPMPDVAKPTPLPPTAPLPLPPRPPETAEIPPPASPPPDPWPGPGVTPPVGDEPPIASGTPPGPSDGIPVFLVVLIAGVAIGAGSVWAWSKWSRRTVDATQRTAGDTPQPALNAADPAHLVFVSYSRQDGRAVDDLVKVIEQVGYTVWIDRHSTGSQRYAAPIVRAIKTSRLVALMCSQNAFTSDHVIREVYVAGDYKKPFIAFQLDRSEFPDDVQYFVSGFPRVPIEALDVQQLRSELARLAPV